MSKLFYVPYSFNWHTTYFLEQPNSYRRGPLLNPLPCSTILPKSFNPDPKKTIKWGDQSWDEMHIGFMEIAFDAGVNAETSTIPTPKSGRNALKRPPDPPDRPLDQK